MFLFSVIMPIYNVGKYLNESITSIINQTIGFKENIQLILINDGSTDKSEKICKEYLEQYPDNIIYQYQENAGVSNARNEGIKYINSKYTIFFDPDDVWDKNAFKEFDNFFTANTDVKLATARVYTFGRKSTKYEPHILDYKYKRSKVVYINKNYDYPEMLVSKTCFLSDFIKGIKFNEQVRFSEDLVFINELILKEEKYGVVREAEYYYRKRPDETSLVDNSFNDIKTFTTTVENVYKYLIKLSKKEKGYIHPYIQYLLLYTIQGKVRRNFDNILLKTDESVKKEVIKNYKTEIRKILKECDDEYILKLRDLSAWILAYLFRIKYGNKAYEKNTYAKRNIAHKLKCTIKLLNVENDQLIIAGDAIEKYIDEDFSIYVKDEDNNIYNAEYRNYPRYDKLNIYEEFLCPGQIHIFKLPLIERAKYRFYIKGPAGEELQLKVSYGVYSRLSGLGHSFFYTDKYIIKQFGNKTIGVYKNRPQTLLASSLRFDRTLTLKGKKEAIEIRERAKLKKKLKKKPIWLVSDRTDLAGDNGEAFFTWLKNNKKDEIDLYFIISKDSPDYPRLKKLGKCLDFGSKKHFITLLAADVLIESSGSAFMYNPFGKDLKFYKDLYDFKCVFLQHGTIIHDLSGWLHWLNTNFNLFVTSATPEYESIAFGDYGYDPQKIVCTGLARHDKLENNTEKIIALAPTWRQSLSNKTEWTSNRGYSDKFKNSDYYNFYNGIINNEELLSKMKEKGYKGILYLHPNHRPQAKDFTPNDTFTICEESFDYSQVFNESALLITDYSSVAMDFAYLRKPIIYTQFDKDEIYKVQVYNEGYFDFERDGFGPVTYTYEDTIKEIINMIENDCVEPEMYKERVDKFFPYNDHNNCQRIYTEIIKL